MSTRKDSGSRSHSRNSNSSTTSSVLVPPPPGSAAMPPNPSVARFSPLDHVSPEVTQSNSLHQLLQRQPPPLPPAPLAVSSPNHFLQQFLASSSSSMPMANSHMHPMGPVPIPPVSTPNLLLPQFQQNLSNHAAFPPPRSAPLPPSFSQFQPVPSLSATSGGTHSAALRSAASASVDSIHSNGARRSASSSLTGSPRRAGDTPGFGTADALTAPPGVRLSGESVEYIPRGEAVSGESRSLEVMPITLYNSERTSQLGNLISVNEHFISYPIRNGLIRVISQSSVDRLLLRKHEHHTVTELAFFNSKSELLLSSGTDNYVAIWAIQKDPMSREVIKLVPTQARRVKWHPSESNKIAIANGSLVFIVDLSGVSADGSGAENLYDISVVCGQDSVHQINDMVFLPNNGECVITAGSDGFVQVYRVQDWQPGQSAEFIHRFEPFYGKTVDSLHFYGGNLLNQQGLFIGGESNTRLSLWNAALMESHTPVCYQSVLLRDETHENSSLLHETIFDSTTQFLFVADRSKPLIYAFHLAPSSDARTPRLFDNVTEFALAYPVLSMGLLNRTAPSQPTHDGSDLTSMLGSLNFSMQLYCLQTQAIQRYHVAATECYIPVTHGSLEDEIEASENAGQSVGAMTTEGESVETSYQTAAESPRAASVAISAPETEIAEEDEEEEGSNAGQQAPLRLAPNGVPPTPSSPTRSIRSTRSTSARSLHLATADDAASVSTSSVTGEIGMLPSLRFYNRSSPSSSVRAFQDESSVQYDPSIDDTASETQQQTLIASLRRMEATQLQRDEELREYMRGVMGSLSNHLTTQVSTQVEKSIQKQLQSVLVPAMGRIVLHTMENNFMKPVQNGFQHVISEKLIPLMERKLDDSLATLLPDQLANGVDDMVQRVVEDVRQPVRESFRECFQDILIPSFQAATQKMFEQINDTFVQGTRSAFESSGQNTSNVKVASQLEQLTEVVEGLRKQVEQLSLTVNAEGMVVALAPIAKSPEELQLEAQQGTVLDYIARNDWEEAFKFALGAQNVNLVAFTCQQCDSRLVLSSRPPKLSQMLILCLVQQLGADLVDDLETKVIWLRESLLVMDVRDQSIAGFVTSVLQELQTGLNSVPAQSRDSQYTLLHHVLNSMLNSA